MPLVTSADLVSSAHANGAAIAAFNVITLEHAEAILAGAGRAGCPVILQVSENAIGFHGGLVAPLLAALRALGVSRRSLRAVVIEQSLWVGLAGLTCTALLTVAIAWLAASM